MEKMREEHNPLTGLWSGDNLLFGRESVSDFRCQIPRLPKLLDVLLCHGGGHPLIQEYQLYRAPLKETMLKLLYVILESVLVLCLSLYIVDLI